MFFFIQFNWKIKKKRNLFSGSKISKKWRFFEKKICQGQISLCNFLIMFFRLILIQFKRKIKRKTQFFLGTYSKSPSKSQLFKKRRFLIIWTSDYKHFEIRSVPFENSVPDNHPLSACPRCPIFLWNIFDKVNFSNLIYIIEIEASWLFQKK